MSKTPYVQWGVIAWNAYRGFTDEVLRFSNGSVQYQFQINKLHPEIRFWTEKFIVQFKCTVKQTTRRTVDSHLVVW